MNSTEIAAQLREIADVYSVGSTNVIAIRKAADMISLMDGHVEDIMMRNQQLVLENEALRQQVENIKNGFEGCCYACEPVGEMNKKLLAERDEARRALKD
jgi:regulator of replication initiation timing